MQVNIVDISLSAPCSLSVITNKVINDFPTSFGPYIVFEWPLNVNYVVEYGRQFFLVQWSGRITYM